MKSLISYVTGCIALIAVSSAVLATLYFMATKPEAGTKLASSMLGGVGSAMGAFIGGALILRFKSARRFIRHILHEEHE